MARRYTMQQVKTTYKNPDTWWGYFLMSRLSGRLVWLTANFTPFPPEVLTVSSFVIGMAAVPFFFTGDPHALVIGGILAFVCDIFDGANGKLARLQGVANDFGSYLDTVLDMLKGTLYVMALMLGQYHRTGDITTLYWGLAALFVYITWLGNENLLGRIRAFLPLPEPGDATASTHPPSVVDTLASRINQFFRRHSLLPAPNGGEFHPIMFILGPLINQVMPCLIVGSACFALYTVAYTAMIFRRTRGLTQGLAKDQQKRDKAAGTRA